MESRIYNVNLQSGYNTLTYIGISQYDAGVPLQFNVYDGATAASFPAGTTATIMGVRPSGVGFSIACTLTDNIVTVDTVTDMTGEAGKFPVEIRFESSGVDVGTVNFVFLIEKAPHPDGTIDADITHEQEFIERLEAVEDDKVPFPATNKYGTAGQVLSTRGDGTTEWISGGTSGDGLTDEIKAALLQLAQKVAYIDEDGQDYYDALYDALYPPVPPATLVSISAVYTQSGTVYDTDTLDSLKTDLVVTAHYDDSTSAVVTTYTLSGTLTAGTSTITVSYGGKTTTFNVTVTSSLIGELDQSDFVIGTIQNAYRSGYEQYGGYITVTSSDNKRMGYPLFDVETEAGATYRVEVDWDTTYDLYMNAVTYDEDVQSLVANHSAITAASETGWTSLTTASGVLTIQSTNNSAMRFTCKIGSAGSTVFQSGVDYINSVKIYKVIE